MFCSLFASFSRHVDCLQLAARLREWTPGRKAGRTLNQRFAGVKLCATHRGTLKLCLGNPVPFTEALHPELQVQALRGGKSLGSPEQEGSNLDDFRQEVFRDAARGNTNVTKGAYGESL